MISYSSPNTPEKLVATAAGFESTSSFGQVRGRRVNIGSN
jgi:hypothetical protein